MFDLLWAVLLVLSAPVRLVYQVPVRLVFGHQYHHHSHSCAFDRALIVVKMNINNKIKAVQISRDSSALIKACCPPLCRY